MDFAKRILRLGFARRALGDAMSGLISVAAAQFVENAMSNPRALAGVIDHTLLKPEATRAQVLQLCAEAAEFGFACAMVNPCWVRTAAEALGGGTRVGVVVGFPLGASLPDSKADEAARVLRMGALDVDMVLNVGFLKGGFYDLVRDDIRGVAEVVHGGRGTLKVILETALLSYEEKLRASEIAIGAGADLIKTSTGFSTGGATAEDVGLMRSVAGERCGVKASGGIRTLADARTMLAAGATRIGASASVRIVQELGGKVGTAVPPGY